MLPEVSIIIPMRNAEPYILQTLTSILQERKCPLEILVVDDQSTDRSAAVVSSVPDPRVRIIDGPGRGIAASFNAGLSHVRGKITMRCDADDLYSHEKIRSQVRWLHAHPDYGAVCGRFATLDEKGKLVREFGEDETSCDITEELCAGLTRTSFCTFAVRTEILQKLGGFRDFFVTAEDIDCQLRLGEQTRVWFDAAVCYYYRLHGTSTIHQQDDDHRQYFDEMARTFQQQRQFEGNDALQRGTPPPLPCPIRNTPPQTASAHIQGLLLGKAWQEHTDGQKFQAIKTGMAAMRYQPNNWSAWKSVFALLVKSSSRLAEKQ
nr:glycosyltransferase family A protein [uncultured Desulfobulbus sp.]